MKLKKLANHALVFGSLVLFLNSTQIYAQNIPKIITATSAYELQQADQLVIFDIRTPKEWRETGVAVGARLITMHNPKGPLAFLDQIKKSVGGDLNKPIAIICASGARSNWAQNFLKINGFSQVTNINEGMLGRGPNPGWLSRKLPLTQP